MRKTIYILLVLLSYTAYSQSLSVFNVDASNFPTIKAKFFAFDATGRQVYYLRPSDLEVKENGMSRTVTDISCINPKPFKAISSVLVMDVSSSMYAVGLEIAKAAAHVWVNMLPLGKSECAITSFSNDNFINQDFTIDKTKLDDAINNLAGTGGTDYNAAMINAMAGGVLIAKTGRFKRAIVFISDGSMNTEPNTEQIINESINNNITIYCVALGTKAPKCMKEFANQTGGLYFENIRTNNEAVACYRTILMTVQGVDPCQIEWKSKLTCFDEMINVEINRISNLIQANASYQSPNNAIAKLEIIPNSLKYLKAIPGIKRDTTISVTAQNADFNVTNITVSNPAFTITPTSFFLNSGQSRNLLVSFVPADSGYSFCKFTFENEICQRDYYANGGFPGKKPKIQTLKLIQPNSGEVFVVGMDTLITWDGILPDDKVIIEYTTNNGTNWLRIADSAKGLSYKWIVPKTPSNLCLARVTAKMETGSVEDHNMVFIPSGTFLMGNTGAYNGDSDEKPIHKVTITKPFFLGKYEVTQKLYESVMNNNLSHFNGENLPVEVVSWYNAVEFCNKLSEKEGLEPCYSGSGAGIICNFDANGYRLPTEAEWEYACKAGSTTDFENGSLLNDGCLPIDAVLDIKGWYCSNSENQTHSVGQKASNAFGLYDMSGNVWEWCWDWYDVYTNSMVSDPKGASTGVSRVLRGGSWKDISSYCRSSNRNGCIPDYKGDVNGFRLCKTYD